MTEANNALAMEFAKGMKKRGITPDALFSDAPVSVVLGEIVPPRGDVYALLDSVTTVEQSERELKRSERTLLLSRLGLF